MSIVRSRLRRLTPPGVIRTCAVATLHSSGVRWSLDIFPEGDPSSSPGLLYSATLGKAAASSPTPIGVVAKRQCGDGPGPFDCLASLLLMAPSCGALAQPRWGWEECQPSTQGSRVQQPWAGGLNHFVVALIQPLRA